MHSGKTRRDFLRMMGAAAGVAVNATLPGIPPNASAATDPSPGTHEKRSLGKTGFRVGTVGFGAMTTRDPEVIRFAVERGWTTSTRPPATWGRERADRREGAGRHPGQGGPATKVKIGTEEEMILSAENSLRSLKADVIDLLQIHNVSTEAEVTDEQARGALRKLIDQGRSARRGHDPQRAGNRPARRGETRVLQDGPRCVQLPFRHGRRGDGERGSRLSEGLSNTIRTVGGSGIGIIAMKTQAGGYASPPGGFSPHQAALAWVLATPA